MKIELMIDAPNERAREATVLWLLKRAISEYELALARNAGLHHEIRFPGQVVVVNVTDRGSL